MKFILAAALAALFFFSSSTSAIAPMKPQEITNFVPVTTAGVVFDPDWTSPRPSLGSNPQERIEPEVIIIDLTTPKPVVHNETTKAPTVASARRYAMSILGSVQYSCIDKLFDRESGWNPLAENKTSGAYGIPQALPGSKMAVIANDWRTNPVTQVKWGIRYVNGRYGSACGAWNFWQVNRWY